MSVKNIATALKVAIVADDKTSKGIKSAKKNINALEGSVKNLGKAFGLAFGTSAVVAFGKATANAFMEDQKSAALLTNTVKNLGLAFADTDIKNFIDQLTLVSGVADDKLRPAMQKLLQVTGSVTKSQELLKNAIDGSRATGVDLETVASDLANAYVGNTKGLKKYALGLTAAELKTASFDKIMMQFNRNFSGANAAYLSTYAGQLDLLKVSAKEAQESIGKGLIDAFKILAGDSTISDLSQKMADLATHIGDFFRGLAQGFKDLAAMPVIHQLLQLAGVMLKIVGKVAGAFIDPFVKSGARARSSALAPSAANSHLAELSAASNEAASKKAEAAAKKRAAALVAAQNKQTKAIKEQNLLKKQGALFDMQQIELVAALKGKLSEEDRKRVELQLALLQGNEEEAARLSNEIANSIDKTGNLANYLQTLPDANNPFKNWYSYLDGIEAQVNRIVNAGANPNNPPTTNAPTSPTWTVGGTAGLNGGSYGGQVQVSVNFQGADSLSNALRDSFVSASMDGSFSQINRTVGAFDR